jgi:hypothetical protein
VAKDYYGVLRLFRPMCWLQGGCPDVAIEEETCGFHQAEAER